MPLPGQPFDVATFADWAIRLSVLPLNRGYDVSGFNYPATAMWLFQGISRFYAAFYHNDNNRTALVALLKTVGSAFDIVGGLYTYAIAKRVFGQRKALVALSIYVLNPAIIYDSAIWGQLDSPVTALLLATLYYTICGKRVLAWVLLTLAVFFKPMGMVFVPLLMIEGGRSHWRETAAGIYLAVITAYCLVWPFAPDKQPWHVLVFVKTQLSSQMAIYPYTTMNAFNTWALPTDFYVSDAGWKTLGNVAFALVSLCILTRYAIRKTPQGLLEAAFLLALGFFLTLTEMHERYMIYAVSLIPVLALASPKYLKCALALSITQWLNLEYAMMYVPLTWPTLVTSVNTHEFAPVLARLCALTNIAVFFTILTNGTKRAWQTYF